MNHPSLTKFDIAYSVTSVCLMQYVFLPFFSTLNSKEEFISYGAQRVHNVCVAKETCRDYAVALNDCAVAYNIEKCIATRMNGKMYFMCKNNGQSRWSENLIEPNYLTCNLNDGILWMEDALQRLSNSSSDKK